MKYRRNINKKLSKMNLSGFRPSSLNQAAGRPTALPIIKKKRNRYIVPATSPQMVSYEPIPEPTTDFDWKFGNDTIYEEPQMDVIPNFDDIPPRTMRTSSVVPVRPSRPIRRP